MMTDPRKACANVKQRLIWALVHDGIAHPLMAVTGYSRLSMRFHDYTSHRAWPRQLMTPGLAPVIMPTRLGILRVECPRPGFYKVSHPRVRHTFCTLAGDAIEAGERALVHFQALADEFGGDFAGVR